MSTEQTQRSRYLYEEIRDRILSRIENGTYAEEQKLPSTRAFVDEFSTTPVTVNRALSDLVDSRHIRRVAKSGSFVNSRSKWGRDQQRVRTGLVGIISFDTKISIYWMQVVEAMQAALETQGIHAVIGYSEHNFEKAHNYVDDLVDKGIDGLIYIPIDASDGDTYERGNRLVCEHIERRGVPFVLFDRRLAEQRFPSVTADVYSAAAQLVRHLADAGSRNPVFVTVEYSQAIREREVAFETVGKELGLNCGPERVVRFQGPRVSSFDIPRFRDLMNAAPTFDGLFIANSNLYSAFLRAEALEGSRWEVPIVTFRDLPTDQPDRPVARAIQPVREFGLVAGQLLARLIEGDMPGAEFRSYYHTVLPVPVERRL